MDLIYLSIIAGFLGCYAYFSIFIAKLEKISSHLEAIRMSTQYVELIERDRLKSEKQSRDT